MLDIKQNSTDTVVISMRLPKNTVDILYSIKSAKATSKAELFEKYILEDWEKNKSHYDKILTLQENVQ